MKKFLLLAFTVLLLLACGSRTKTNKSVGLKGFSAYYNTLFNSKDALETELKNRDKAHKDNFYAPYISILTTENQPAGSDLAGAQPGIFGESSAVAAPSNPPAGASILQISEAKALKALEKYSVIKDGVEKNKKMFDASILLAQSRLYQNKPLDALNALNNIFANMPNDKRADLAKIYQAQAYAQMGDYYRSNEIFRALNDLPRDYDRLKTVYYAEMLVDGGRKEEAVAELANAFEAHKNREIKSRIAFLRGQLLASMNQKTEARDSFTTAYQLANDFEFEVKSQVEIAKTFNSATDDYSGAKDYLEKVSRKGTYASRKNELYYALGLLPLDAAKAEEAQNYFKMSLAEKVSDPQIRGLTYYEIGRHYLKNDDYVAAGAYYDSAVATMNYQPARARLLAENTNIKKITENYYLIKRNDSILALAHMAQPERDAYFSKYIDGLRAREAQILEEEKKTRRNAGFDTGDYAPVNSASVASPAFQDFSANNKGFYFANQNAVSRGRATFRQLWGSRSLQDNWRFSARTASIEDLRNETMGLTSAKDPRRFETSFYTEQIPNDAATLAQLKKARDTASLGLAVMYDSYFGNRPLATKTLYDLVEAKPENDVKLQALYQIFSMNYENDPSAAERAKSMILAEYPSTPYAEFVKNPKSTVFVSSNSEVEKQYLNAYKLYTEGRFAESSKIIDEALKKHPRDALAPKFTLLNAYNAGQISGRDVMMQQLQQLSLNYGKTPEGLRAADMMKNFESGLAAPAGTAAVAAPNLQNMQTVAPQQAIRAEGDVSAGYVQQTVGQPVPQINTTQNVVQPAQSEPMPTSPPVKPNDTVTNTVPVNAGPPVQKSNETTSGVPVITPKKQKRINENTR